MRVTGRCVNNSLPLIPVIPLELREARQTRSDDRVEMEFEGNGSDYLNDVQIIRKTEAVVANTETRFEINDNQIIVPIVSKSKNLPLKKGKFKR